MADTDPTPGPSSGTLVSNSSDSQQLISRVYGLRSRLSTRGGPFANAHHFAIHNPTMYSYEQNTNIEFKSNGLEVLSRYIEPGAEYDSSARDPPPRCHPGTRIEILETASTWISGSKEEKKLLWLYGPAGVGKSAIMQTIAETESQNGHIGATFFFSEPNHRNDYKRLFTTFAHQLAVSRPFYRTYIDELLHANPGVPEKALAEQFKWFIARPFAEQKIYKGSNVLAMLLDGLDECEGKREQSTIIELISSFVLQYPDVPLVWIIASREEPHISNAFSRDGVEQSAWRIEVPANSKDAWSDVEQFLRAELQRIKQSYPRLFSANSRWPDEHQILRLVNNAAGRFIYASSVIKYIEDPDRADPISRLEAMIGTKKFEETGPTFTTSVGESDLGAASKSLDIFYAHLMSTIPEDLLPTAKLLMGYYWLIGGGGFFWSVKSSFLIQCNILGIDKETARDSLQPLHPVITVPAPEAARWNTLTLPHRSFYEFLVDSKRSKSYFIDLSDVMTKVWRRCFVILKQVASGSYFKDNTLVPVYSNVELSWPSPDRERLRAEVYHTAQGQWSGVLFHSSHWRGGKPDPIRCLTDVPELIQMFKQIEYPKLPLYWASRLWYFFGWLSLASPVELQQLFEIGGVSFSDLDMDQILTPLSWHEATLIPPYRRDTALFDWPRDKKTLEEELLFALDHDCIRVSRIGTEPSNFATMISVTYPLNSKEWAYCYY